MVICVNFFIFLINNRSHDRPTASLTQNISTYVGINGFPLHLPICPKVDSLSNGAGLYRHRSRPCLQPIQLSSCPLSHLSEGGFIHSLPTMNLSSQPGSAETIRKIDIVKVRNALACWKKGKEKGKTSSGNALLNPTCHL
jgi:hypothetical protein